MNEQVEREHVVALTAEIVSAYVSNNPLPIRELAALIESVHKSLAGLLRGDTEQVVEPAKPAVPVGKSVHGDYIVCLEDGKKFKTLKRHLNEGHGMAPVEYLRKWGLPPDYPMMAPNYAAARSAFARSMGFGYKKSVPAPAKRGRKKAAPDD